MRLSSHPRKRVFPYLFVSLCDIRTNAFQQIYITQFSSHCSQEVSKLTNFHSFVPRNSGLEVTHVTNRCKCNKRDVTMGHLRVEIAIKRRPQMY